MGGRKSTHAEQSPSLGFALRMLLSVNVFHEKPEYPICCTSAAWCLQDLDTLTIVLPLLSAGRVSFAAQSHSPPRLAALPDSVGVERFHLKRDAVSVG